MFSPTLPPNVQGSQFIQLPHERVTRLLGLMEHHCMPIGKHMAPWCLQDRETRLHTCLPICKYTSVETSEGVVQNSKAKALEYILLAGKVFVIAIESPETVIKVEDLTRGEEDSSEHEASTLIHTSLMVAWGPHGANTAIGQFQY